jgi:hypothetical protein
MDILRYFIKHLITFKDKVPRHGRRSEIPALCGTIESPQCELSYQNYWVDAIGHLRIVKKSSFWSKPSSNSHSQESDQSFSHHKTNDRSIKFKGHVSLPEVSFSRKAQLKRIQGCTSLSEIIFGLDSNLKEFGDFQNRF